MEYRIISKTQRHPTGKLTTKYYIQYKITYWLVERWKKDYDEWHSWH